MDDAKITGMRAAQGGAHLTLYISGSDEAGTPAYLTLTVLSSRLTHLPVPGPIDPETVSLLQKEHEVCGAVTYGLRALAAADLSAGMLVHRLRLRGVPAAAAKEAAQELAERGYLNEKRAALGETERGIFKLWGNRRILAELASKGFGQAALDAAAERLAEEDGGQRCATLLRKKRVSLPADPRGQQKLFASLARYGYSSGEIKAALTAVFGQ